MLIYFMRSVYWNHTNTNREIAHMSMTAFERHDSSPEPTREERLLDEVIEDINNGGTASLEAANSLLMLGDGSIIRDSFRMLLTNALGSKGSMMEKDCDEKLGKYIKTRMFDAIKQEIE